MELKPMFIEVPVKDIERAVRFYGTVFGVTPEIHADDVRRTAVLNDGSTGTGFALNQTADFEPSDHGPLVYLHVSEPLDALLARVERAGGKIVRAPESMGEGMGPYAMFADSEGNVFAFYADAS